MTFCVYPDPDSREKTGVVNMEPRWRGTDHREEQMHTHHCTVPWPHAIPYGLCVLVVLDKVVRYLRILIKGTSITIQKAFLHSLHEFFHLRGFHKYWPFLALGSDTTLARQYRAMISCRREKQGQGSEVPQQHLGLQLPQPGKPRTLLGDDRIMQVSFKMHSMCSSFGVVQKEEGTVEETRSLKSVLSLWRPIMNLSINV